MRQRDVNLPRLFQMVIVCKLTALTYYKARFFIGPSCDTKPLHEYSPSRYNLPRLDK